MTSPGDISEAVKAKSVSMGQLMVLMVTVGATSGLGGAYTVSAQDAVQDAKIERVEVTLDKVSRKMEDMHDSIIVLKPQLSHMDNDMAQIKADLKEILDHIAHEEGPHPCSRP